MNLYQRIWQTTVIQSSPFRLISHSTYLTSLVIHFTYCTNLFSLCGHDPSVFLLSSRIPTPKRRKKGWEDKANLQRANSATHYLLTSYSVWIAFSVIFHENITVTIWCMRRKKIIRKCDHEKQRNFFLTENGHPNRLTMYLTKLSQSPNPNPAHVHRVTAVFRYRMIGFWNLLSYHRRTKICSRIKSWRH